MGIAPYEVLSVNGVVGVGLPDDPPGLAPHSLAKTLSLRTSDRFTAVAIRPPSPKMLFPSRKKGPATRQSPFSNRFNSSEIRIAHRARVQLHIPDVAHSREVHDHPLKAQAEARVLAGAVAP